MSVSTKLFLLTVATSVSGLVLVGVTGDVRGGLAALVLSATTLANGLILRKRGQ